MVNIKKWLIKRNPFISEDLKRERLWKTKAHIKEVPCHGYGINNKYKNKPNSVCYSLAPTYPTTDGKHHSFVSYGKNKYEDDR